MKKIFFFGLFFFLTKISLCQDNNYSIKSDSSKPCCVVTGIDVNKLIIITKKNQDNKIITFKSSSDIINLIRKGDTIYVIEKGDIKKNIYTAKVVNRPGGKIRSGLVVVQ